MSTTEDMFDDQPPPAATPETEEVIETQWSIGSPEATPRLKSVKRVQKPKKKRSRQADHQAKKDAEAKEQGKTRRAIHATDEEFQTIKDLLSGVTQTELPEVVAEPVKVEPVATPPAPATLDDILVGQLAALAPWKKSLIRWIAQ
jgi:hypothetical protein